MSNAIEMVKSSRKELVQKLISNMEQGYLFSKEKWDAQALRPQNPVSGAVYRGGNRLRLSMAAVEKGYRDPRWMTFKQASDQGYHIRKGEKSILLEKWIFTREIKEKDEQGQEVKKTVRLEHPVCNYFRVFNAEQMDGVEPLPKEAALQEDEVIKLTEQFFASSKCDIVEAAQEKAYYSPENDQIVLPPRRFFKSPEAFLSIGLHEMAHSTGNEKRLNRPLMNGFGTEEYAREELNAEISSAFLESDLGLEADHEGLRDHSNYLKSWIRSLKEDPNELFRACQSAEKISEYLMGNYQEYLENEPFMNFTNEMEVAAVKMAIKRSLKAQDPNMGLKYIKDWREKIQNKNLNVEEVENVFCNWAKKKFPDKELPEINEQSVQQRAPRRYAMGSDQTLQRTFEGKLPEEMNQEDVLKFMVDTDLMVSGKVTDQTLNAIKQAGYRYQDGQILPALPQKDPIREPLVTIKLSEHPEFEEGEFLPLSEANQKIQQLDQEVRAERVDPEHGSYCKIFFEIHYQMGNVEQTYSGRQDLGDGDGSLIDHIELIAETELKDLQIPEVAQTLGQEYVDGRMEHMKYAKESLVPYLKLHTNLSEMERTATNILNTLRDIPNPGAMERTNVSYHTAVLSYVSDCRKKLNQGNIELPKEPQKEEYMDPEDRAYRNQIKAEIEQEAKRYDFTEEETLKDEAAEYDMTPEEFHEKVFQSTVKDHSKDMKQLVKGLVATLDQEMGLHKQSVLESPSRVEELDMEV